MHYSGNVCVTSNLLSQQRRYQGSHVADCTLTWITLCSFDDIVEPVIASPVALSSGNPIIPVIFFLWAGRQMERWFLHKETLLCFIPDIVLTCIFANSFKKLALPLPTPPTRTHTHTHPSPSTFAINLLRHAAVAGGSLQPVIEATKAES